MATRSSALKNKLFITYAAIITFVVFLFTVFLVTGTATQNRQTELYHQQEIYRNSLVEIESILWQMDRLAMQIVSDNEILNIFIALGAEEKEGNYFATNLIDFIRISSLLSGINGTDNYAARICVYNRGGDYVSAGTLYETPQRIDQALLDTDAYDRTVERIQHGGQNRLVSGFDPDRWSSNPGVRLLSLKRALTSFSGTVHGLVDVQITIDALSRLGFWGLSEAAEPLSQEYLLTGPDGAMVYPLAARDDLKPALERIYTAVHAGGEAPEGFFSFRERIGGDECILLASKVNLSDWLFVRILPIGSLTAPYVSSYLMMGFVSLILLLLLIVVVYYASSRIARPLRDLATSLTNVNLNNMRTAIGETQTEYSTEELAALSSAYRTMLSRLDRSIAMEIQAHLRALQSQMNPHFLYNMLSVIIESSEEEGCTRTVSMCMKLSLMLRYIADYNGDSASLADEVAHARNYLDLMKERYEEHFLYTIETEEGIDRIIVPKMILQPLTENCFTHGFKDRRPPWQIRITVRIVGARWVLYVYDNGIGITEDTIQAIHDRVAAYRVDMATSYQQLRLGGMGLVNTLIRLSLYENEEISFAIENHPEGGTVVTIGGSLHDPRADLGG
ncbi:MAG: histidine kinase [Clostridia bacterium]|nr:histidine kinase [Clostridia bacterium]